MTDSSRVAMKCTFGIYTGTGQARADRAMRRPCNTCRIVSWQRVSFSYWRRSCGKVAVAWPIFQSRCTSQRATLKASIHSRCIRPLHPSPCHAQSSAYEPRHFLCRRRAPWLRTKRCCFVHLTTPLQRNISSELRHSSRCPKLLAPFFIP